MMKSRFAWLLPLLSLLVSVPAWAGEGRTGFTLTPMVGWQVFEGNQYLKDRPFGGLALGYDFRGGWSLEGAGTYLETSHNKTGQNGSLDLYTLHLDVIKHFRAEQRWVPYVVVGAGAQLTKEEKSNGGQRDEDLLLAYGVGLKYYLPDDVALRLDLRHLIDYANGDHWGTRDYYSNAMVSFGVTVPFGRTSTPAVQPVRPVAATTPVAPPVVQEAPVVLVDTDGDGVEDSRDRCEVTPAGTPVDEFGCPRTLWRDSDGDGIGDEMDRCPGTSPRALVDANGCPRDSDNDGVSDDSDRCPNTPAQIPVNEVGCPRDSDGDLVFDVDDRCPDTPAGTAVDATGCPVQQKPANAAAAALAAEKRGLRLNILFDKGKTEILPRYRQELAAAAEYLNSNRQGLYYVEGHTDSVGSAEANRLLSEKRAQSVRSYLIKQFRIDPKRLEARGLGESRPIGDNATVEGRALNRRVVLVPKTP